MVEASLGAYHVIKLRFLFPCPPTQLSCFLLRPAFFCIILCWARFIPATIMGTAA